MAEEQNNRKGAFVLEEGGGALFSGTEGGGIFFMRH